MDMIEGARLERTRALNDSFRRSLRGGRLLLTSGIIALGADCIARIVMKIREFDTFDDGNDPFGEHDFGVIDEADQRIFFKLDYYDPNMIGGSEDPTDPAKTIRVLTVMLAEEY